MASKHQNIVVLHTDDFKNYWGGNFCLPGEKKPFTGTLEVCLDKNPFNLKSVITHRISFKDGNHHGVYEEFHENGNLSLRMSFKEGIHYGVYEKFYENGNLSSRMHNINDHPGGYVRFNNNAKLSLRNLYKNKSLYDLASSCHVREEFYESGKLRLRLLFKDHLSHWIREEFFENGNLRTRDRYKNNQRVCEEFYENGKPSRRDHYENDQINGVSEIFKLNGKLDYRAQYKKGKFTDFLQN